MGVDDPEKIETMANENDYDQNPNQTVVFGGVIFQSITDESALTNINYTLRLRTEFVQRLSNFLFMPYTFSGPQRWGEEYNLFCSLQTLIDLSYMEFVTGEKLLIKDVTNPTDLLRDLKWVKLSLYEWYVLSLVVDDQRPEDGLPALLQQQPLPAARLHPPPLSRPLLLLHRPAHPEEDRLREGDRGEGVDEANGPAQLDALAVLVHQLRRHLRHLQPHHGHPPQLRVQVQHWGGAGLQQPSHDLHLPLLLRLCSGLLPVHHLNIL